MNRPQLSRTHFSVAGIVVLVCLTRLPGLTSAVFMDEVYILRAVNQYVSQRTIIPPWFDWSPLFSYLSVPAVGLSAIVGGLTSGLTPTDWLLVQSAFAGRGMILGTRLLSVALSVATAVCLWRAADDHANPAERLYGIFIFSLSPIAVRYGAWGLADSGMLFGVAAATFYSLRHVDTGALRPLLYAGAFTGVAAAFKYNGALAALTCIAAAVLSAGSLPPARRIRWLVGSGLVSLATFLTLAPTWVLTPHQALNGFLFHARNVHRVPIAPSVKPWLGVPVYLLRYETGMLIGYLAIIVMPFIARDYRRAVVIGIVPLAVFAIVGGWARMDINYLLPALPGLSLAAALGLCVLNRAVAAPKVAWVLPASVVAILGALLLRSGRMPLGTDNFFGMRTWLGQNLERNATVFRFGGYTPKVWDRAAVSEYLESRGRNLSDKGKAAFQAELQTHPQAVRVASPDETTSMILTTLSPDGLASGTWFLISERPLVNMLQANVSPSAANYTEYKTQLDFLRDLTSGTGWELAHEETQGAGQAHYAYRKRR
jgi:hypothetical protein